MLHLQNRQTKREKNLRYLKTDKENTKWKFQVHSCERMEKVNNAITLKSIIQTLHLHNSSLPFRSSRVKEWTLEPKRLKKTFHCSPTEAAFKQQEHQKPNKHHIGNWSLEWPNCQGGVGVQGWGITMKTSHGTQHTFDQKCCICTSTQNGTQC